MLCSGKSLSDSRGLSQYTKIHYVSNSNQHALVTQSSLPKRLQHSSLLCRASEQEQKREEGASIGSKSKGEDAAQNMLDNNADRAAITSDVILGACVRTSGLIALVALGIHFAAPWFAPAKFDGHEALFDAYYNGGNSGTLENIAIAAVTGLGVTAARQVLIYSWSDFKESTDGANSQILLPLSGFMEMLVVASLPAVSEEMLFRWALIPAIYPDWRGAFISGIVFGILHLNGGRNAAFALWASIIGCLYGSLYLHSEGSLVVPILAHAAANISSAQVWINSKSR